MRQSGIANHLSRAQVHPDKCSHPHATAAFEVLGHANQQLQSEEVMHELRHVLTLARGTAPVPSSCLAAALHVPAASRQLDSSALPQQGAGLCSLMLRFCAAAGRSAACMGCVSAGGQRWVCVRQRQGQPGSCDRVSQSAPGTMGRGLPGSPQVRGACC